MENQKNPQEKPGIAGACPDRVPSRACEMIARLRALGVDVDGYRSKALIRLRVEPGVEPALKDGRWR